MCELMQPLITEASNHLCEMLDQALRIVMSCEQRQVSRTVPREASDKWNSR
jgi:hypothetical protein